MGNLLRKHSGHSAPPQSAPEASIDTRRDRSLPALRALVVRCVLVLAGFAFAALPFEIGFRLWGSRIRRPDPTRDRPQSYYAPSDSHSQADFEYPLEKPSGVFRIAAIGDSFTFPTHMQFDDAYPKRLERMLNLGSSNTVGAHRAEVMSFGMMGASSKSEVEIVRKALRYHPDMILLQITLNDPEPKNFHEQQRKHPERYDFGELVINEKTHPLLNHWKSLAFLVQRLHNTRTLTNVIEYYRDMYRPDGPWPIFTSSIRRIQKLADEQGVKLVAVVFPLFYTPLDERYPFQDIHQQIVSYLGEQAIPVLDLLQSFGGMPPERLVVLPGEDSHPNEIAHRVAADTIYNWFEKNRYIPESLFITRRYLKRGNHPSIAPTAGNGEAVRAVERDPE